MRVLAPTSAVADGTNNQARDPRGQLRQIKEFLLPTLRDRRAKPPLEHHPLLRRLHESHSPSRIAANVTNAGRGSPTLMQRSVPVETLPPRTARRGVLQVGQCLDVQLGGLLLQFGLAFSLHDRLPLLLDLGKLGH